jgi:lactoylglutathione lyase
MSFECCCDFAPTPTRSSPLRAPSSRLFPRSELPAPIGRAAPADPAPWPQGEVAFFVEDVDAEHARLQAAGITVPAPPIDRPWGERTLHVADPDGNVVELTRAKQPS